MTRVTNMNLGAIIQCQYTRTILKNKSIGQSLFRKPFEFHNFSEIFYCGMTRFRNTILDVFTLPVHMIYFKRKNMGEGLFKKHSKFL